MKSFEKVSIFVDVYGCQIVIIRVEFMLVIILRDINLYAKMVYDSSLYV